MLPRLRDPTLSDRVGIYEPRGLRSTPRPEMRFAHEEKASGRFARHPPPYEFADRLALSKRCGRGRR